MIKDYEGAQPVTVNLSKEILTEISKETIPEYRTFIQEKFIGD